MSLGKKVLKKCLLIVYYYTLCHYLLMHVWPTFACTGENLPLKYIIFRFLTKNVRPLLPTKWWSVKSCLKHTVLLVIVSGVPDLCLHALGKQEPVELWLPQPSQHQAQVWIWYLCGMFNTIFVSSQSHTSTKCSRWDIVVRLRPVQRVPSTSSLSTL